MCQFAPDLGGQFAPDSGGQLRPDKGGHVERIFYLNYRIFTMIQLYPILCSGYTYTFKKYIFCKAYSTENESYHHNCYA